MPPLLIGFLKLYKIVRKEVLKHSLTPIFGKNNAAQKAGGASGRITLE
jgi:hypothetical protein